MQVPLEIAFEGMDPSDAIEARVRKEARRLERFSSRITSCRVVIELPGKRHHHGDLFAAHVHVTMPGGGEIVAGRSSKQDHSHEDVYVAIRDSFSAACRQLEDHVRKRGGNVKHHEEPPHGHVVRLFPYEGYGFIETPDGREIYFSRNSVVENGFDRLRLGSEVRFAEAMGEKGPQASTVHIVRP